MDTFAKLREEREGVEWVRNGVILRMSSRRRRSPCCWQQSAIGPDCRRSGDLALDAAQLAQSPGRAECGVGGAPETGVGHAFCSGPGGRDLPASPRERSAAPGARHFKKGCGHFLGTAEMRFRLIE